jgi:hypothetical protein
MVFPEVRRALAQLKGLGSRIIMRIVKLLSC